MDTSDSQSSQEYEREPVPESAQLGFKSFLGLYAGEHCAGTELLIGPLFVAAGVGARDLLLGLFLGNLLAVFSWTFLTAPIATQARLTLYYQLEKICGRKLVTLYNLISGALFCFLAGMMITVSGTAVCAWANFSMPPIEEFAPTSVGWVLSILVVGAAVSFVAASGYKTLSTVSNFTTPWVVLVFLAFGIVALKQLIQVTDTDARSPAELWHLAETVLWKGGEPMPGHTKFTFWHVMFFAWFCNTNNHIGMVDLSVLRFAKKSWYAVASAAGMFLGHFMAWVSASLLYALQLHQDPSNTTVLPGPMAYNTVGFAGVACVVVAGWTTANPTIYRAGLAIQAIMPSRSRFAITLAVGALATTIGIFPWFSTKLLGFLAINSLILMPMGAILFTDHYLFKCLGLIPYYAEQSRSHFNMAAAIAWLLTLVICMLLVLKAGIPIYFVSLPGWFIAVISFLTFSYFSSRDACLPENSIREARQEDFESDQEN